MTAATATAKSRQTRAVEQRLTTDEAADVMRCSKDFVLAAIKTGALPAKKIGKGYRIKPSDLDTWYDQLEDA